MKRPLHTWIAFALCLAVVLAAMGWASLTVLRLDRAEAEAGRRAAFEETVRLALWRADSELAPLIATESARPYFQYSAFYPAERAYTRMFAELRRGDVLFPSPLLTRTPRDVLIHFQFDPKGELTSPQAPSGNMRDLAESAYTSHASVEQSTRRLRTLGAALTRDALLARLPRSERTPPPRPSQGAVVPRQHTKTQSAEWQTRLNTQEWSARQRRQVSAQQGGGQAAHSPSSRVAGDVMVPLWVAKVLGHNRPPASLDQGLAPPGQSIEGRAGRLQMSRTVAITIEVLVLARRIEVGKEVYVQGLWLDWPGIRARLRDEVRDLLPAAEFVPVKPGPRPGPEGRTRTLASLPARLVPGEAPADGEGPASPIRISLVIAWICVLLGAGAVGVLLAGALSLSERRGAFVSAVTHELRTPLTTFRMYAEMLAEDMVPDESKRREYLRTLCTEADRLGHLVENVLAYAGLEGSGARAGAEVVTLGELVGQAEGRLVSRLNERAASGGMELVVHVDAEATDGAGGARVRVNASAVEQILFNLVDNACKYAASAEDRRIHLDARLSGGCAALEVRDHGPGIDRGYARRLFRPFSKSARDAAGSAPGVGLGLALSRRLARRMGGELRHVRCEERERGGGADEGACFELSLPLART